MALLGKNPFISSYNWAASVLLWLRMSVGLLTWAMTLAMVKVFPDPVTPKRTCALSPRNSPVVSCRMASGWSPVGLKSEEILKSVILQS